MTESFIIVDVSNVYENFVDANKKTQSILDRTIVFSIGHILIEYKRKFSCKQLFYRINTHKRAVNMDPALLREREAFKKRAMAVPT